MATQTTEGGSGRANLTKSTGLTKLRSLSGDSN